MAGEVSTDREAVSPYFRDSLAQVGAYRDDVPRLAEPTIKKPFVRDAAGRRRAYSIVLGERRAEAMLYTIPCYDSEEYYSTWTQEQDDALIAKLGVVVDKLEKQGKLGPVARLMPTTTATSLRKGRETVVFDGPFAETKEQLLGFYVVECATLEEALEIAAELGRVSGSAGTFEVRPIASFHSGGATS
jgi:hypothetical protein